MKKTLGILICSCALLALHAKDNPLWQQTGCVAVDGGRARIAAVSQAQSVQFRALQTWQVTPGVNYHFSLDSSGAVKTGEINVELRTYSGYDGTPESVKNLKQLSVISAGKILPGQLDGRRTLLCTFTAPSGASGIQVHAAVRDFTGDTALGNLKLVQGDNTLTIPRVTELPAMDGKWHPEFAAKVLSVQDFLAVPLKDGKLEPVKTFGAMAMTNTHFYGEFLLKQEGGIPWTAHGLPRDHQDVWRDDSIELFLTHVGGQKPVYQFIATIDGTLYDSSNDNQKWNSDSVCKGAVQPDGTAVVQIMIPLKDLGYVPGIDDNIIKPVWRFNVRRNYAKCAGRASERQSTLAALTEMGDINRYLRIMRKNDDKGTAYSPLFNSESAYTAMERAKRFWRPAKPLFKELLSDRKPLLAGEGNILWYHQFDPTMIPFALQYGIPWTHEDTGKIFRDNHLHMFGVYDVMIDWAESAAAAPGCGAILHGPIWVRNWSMNHSEAAKNEFIETLKKSIKAYPGKIWAVTLGDEVIIRLRNTYVARAADENYVKSNPEFRKMIETIKRDYGFGKYTIPKGTTEGNPFGTLALCRYLCDKAAEFEKAVRAMLDEHFRETGEKILLLAHDPMGYTPDEYFSRSSAYCDLYTLQTGPAHHTQRQQIAFMTQLIRDLVSPRPVWPCVHTESYLSVYTPEEVYAAMSEAVRGGATGWHIFNRDTRGRLAKTGDTVADYYGDRPRWDATMEIARTLEKMNALKFPVPSFGLFYSTDLQFSESTYDILPVEMAYNMTGPGAGAYMKIMDDIQLEDGAVKLSQWPLVLVPDAQIERKSVSGKFLEYVQNGGTVICTDPEVFSYHIDGSDTFRLREEIFGAKTVAKKRNSPIALAVNDPFLKGQKTGELPLFSSEYHLEPMAGTRVLARFKDGAAAITLKEFPKGGKAVLFAFELDRLEPLQNQAAWHDFFRQIFKNYSIPTDLPIWNFELPIPEKFIAPKLAEPKLQCLTGNNFVWFENVPRKIGNVNLPGAYYVLGSAPDSDKTGRTKFAFSEGNLTNRLAALLTPDLSNSENMPLIRKGTLSLNMFADVWTKTDAFEVRFVFPAPVTVEKVRIVFANTLPDFKVSCDGGKTFTAGKSRKGNPVADDVVRIFTTGSRGGGDNDILLHAMGDVNGTELDIPAQKTKEAVIRFEKRPDGERMILSEIEIWGKAN